MANGFRCQTACEVFAAIGAIPGVGRPLGLTFEARHAVMTGVATLIW